MSGGSSTSLLHAATLLSVLRDRVCSRMAPGADPVQRAAQARVFGRPAAHGSVGCLKFGIDGLVGDGSEFLEEGLDKFLVLREGPEGRRLGRSSGRAI
jgi:hypothetical protein